VAWFGFNDRGEIRETLTKTMRERFPNYPIDDMTPVYTHPQPRKRVVFPTMLRKMWSGGEVQAWLDKNVNKE
jgi:hypothetical protein